MHIGRVAKKIGLTPDAIRFYERNIPALEQNLNQ
jgi:DNA-binding transcriptional MerR regulator